MTKIEELEAKLKEISSQLQDLKEQEFEPFWEPTNGKDALCIGATGGILHTTRWSASEIKLGMAYETGELAQKAIEYRLAEQRIRKAVWNLNKGLAPKFVAGFPSYGVGLHDGDVVTTNWIMSQTAPDWLWLHTEVLAEQLIESHSKDLMVYLHGI